MKIAIYYNEFFSCGGIEKQVIELSKKLKENGHKVYVIFTSVNSSIDTLIKISKYAKVIRIDKQRNECYDIAIYEAIYNLEKINANKYIQVLNGNLIDGNEKYETTINFDEYIAVSQDCANQFQEKIGKTAKVIPNLIDSKRIIELSKENINIEKGDITFATVSRIDPMKRI